MAIKFGGNSVGYIVNTPNFDTKTFDCGTDYRLFINRIDKVCKKSRQSNDGICAMKQNVEDLKEFTGGDCVQRINITATEVPYTPIMEANHPCIDINDIVETDALLVASDGTCQPGIKAIEINIAFSGYGDGTVFLDDPAAGAAKVGEFDGVDAQIISLINDISFWIIQDYGYDAPIDDFHTFNITLRGIKVAGVDERLDIQECAGDSNFFTTRITINLDTVNGIIREEREVTFQGEYESTGEASTSFSVQCG
jgi:hypothetical protein